MLLAVEGGGFFSSSASGYSKGLTLLLLGQKDEDKPMRVSPWNHYQLVDQESESDLQLASTKNRISRGCASFVCFGRTSAGLDSSPSPLKVGPTLPHDSLPGPLSTNTGKDEVPIVNDGNSLRNIALKSSLKKPNNGISISHQNAHESETMSKKDGDIRCPTDRRKVQWNDACGSELVEIREFEPSEAGLSDDELENGNKRSCSCAIM
ncbi:uncharacterized protein LOC111022876 isoform X2 [Momordica charantia]|uniref:Uncharacterized protein LOC111022876 isoform X2 n=1 Tax=Momordica charantia TaxID=3673 RepID=A0A6J1DP18_MOMCH|nr:uncharacterized protein LOC111022876 isoform X2 [Momordica charantia]